MDKLQQKINNGREFRAMELTPTEENYKVVGYATTYDQPYHLYNMDENTEITEQVSARAFDNADMSDVIMQYDHQGRVFARISNNTLKLSKDNDHGLLIEADLSGTEIGRQLFEEIKGGYTSKMSFGFTVGKAHTELVSNDGSKRVYLRTIDEISKVFDVSAVSLPANDGTEISARHAIDGEIGELEAERLERERREALKAEIRSMLKKGN